MRLAQLYPRELLAETVRIAARCDFSLDCLRYEYPEELVPAGETPASHLRRSPKAAGAALSRAACRRKCARWSNTNSR